MPAGIYSNRKITPATKLGGWSYLCLSAMYSGYNSSNNGG